MDPYIESPAHWPDFHGTFINTLREVIADSLPDEYFARIQEDVVLLEPDAITRSVVPDVLIAADKRTKTPSAPGGLATLEPATLSNIIQIDPHVEHFIEILRLPDAEIVGVVEVLSPSNKTGDGRGVYKEKRNRLLRQQVHLIEIDLLRAGRRIDLYQPFPVGHYHAMISRADRRPDCQVYSWTVRDKLPTIPIPLRAPTPDSSADLGKAFAMAYQRARYGRIVRYDVPPPPPEFGQADEAWVRAIGQNAAKG